MTAFCNPSRLVRLMNEAFSRHDACMAASQTEDRGARDENDLGQCLKLGLLAGGVRLVNDSRGKFMIAEDDG